MKGGDPRLIKSLQKKIPISVFYVLKLSYLRFFPLLSEPVFRFKFADAGNMAPPLISFSEVAFSYSGKKKDYLFKDVSFGIHPSSRIVLVGPNGAGNYVAADE